MKLERMFLAGITTVLLATFCSCADKVAPVEQNATLTIDVESVTVGPEASETSIKVKSDCDWGVYAQDDWVSVSPEGGIAGETVVKVYIKANPSQNDSRSTNIVFRYGSSKKAVPVVQALKVKEANISDPAFKAYLVDEYDVNSDGIFSETEALSITRLEISGLGIKELTALSGLFPDLEYLDCSDNALTTLDLKGLSRLSYLDCSGNELTSLDLSSQSALVYLDCSDNDILILDIVHLLGLQTFDSRGNDDLSVIYVWNGFEASDGFSKPDSAVWEQPEVPTPAGYRLVWRDEFDDASLQTPDENLWWYETAGPGWVNNELQTYVAGKEGDVVTADVSDGTLKIHAINVGNKRVLSARVNTREGWQYGYFEARLKLPKGLGTWPAFWMMPQSGSSWPKCGEIDIMEHVGADLNQVSSSIHCQEYYHAIGTQKTKARYLEGATDEFHVYALEWTPEYIRSFVDGEELFYYNPDMYLAGRNENTWPFDKPFHLKLNLAWGGDWGGYRGVDWNCLPQTYEIDYVRVFQKSK